MDLVTFLMQSDDLLHQTDAAQFASSWKTRRVRKSELIVRQGEREPNEYILLEGCAASRIYGPQGRAVCVSLHVAPCIVAPNIARTRDGVSLVSIEAMRDGLLAQMDSNALTKLMIASAIIRNWGNAVLRQELGRRVDREWCLAALGGADRLKWFRERYPGHEDLFNHSLIASFIGVTPVTFSRLRSSGRPA